MNFFSQVLISWYKKNKRDLPWRNTQNAYEIWLSEIILQQTRVEQGRSYYHAFVSKFPTVKDLAKAPSDVIMKTWQGLGYYSRARNLHATAKTIVEYHKGKFPSTYAELIALKGIGPYTAAAVASFASNEKVAVVDGNVYRVLARYFGIETPIDSGQGKKEFQQLADELLNTKHPGLHNQAIMEFGALQCKPKGVDCSVCPLQDNCAALAEGKVDQLPVKNKKTKIRSRYFYYLIIEDAANKTYLHKRSGKDIWAELYEFPLVEHAAPLPEKELLKQLKKFFGEDEFVITKRSAEHKHILSHQHLHTVFIHIKSKTKLKKRKEFDIIKMTDVNTYALPRLIDRYINN